MSRNPYENLPDGVEGRAFREFRAADEEGNTIEGHAATFGEPYNLGEGIREQIAPGAFDGVLEDDVRALVNHNPDKLLGRTSSGTLEVGTDETGLTARVDLPDTSDGRDVRELVQRGDLDQMSFGFSVASDSWETLEDGTELRTIEEVGALWDVSPVTFPANPNTDVALRSREAWKEAETRDEDEPIEDADTPEPVDTLTVRLDADASELEAELDRLLEKADMVRDALGAVEDEPEPEADEPVEGEEETGGVDAGTLKRRLELEAAKAE